MSGFIEGEDRNQATLYSFASPKDQISMQFNMPACSKLAIKIGASAETLATQGRPGYGELAQGYLLQPRLEYQADKASPISEGLSSWIK